jgi:hydrogenase nickel incorporation protein HypB
MGLPHGAAQLTQSRLAEVRQKVLNKNDAAARVLRDRYRDAGVCVISLVSSPGSGKTAFLERLLSELRPRFRVAALVGDLATDNDAVRLARSGAPVRQIQTGTICHLDASMVSNALDDWSLNDLDFLFIENVGNLVCPSSYDLGEDARMVLLSVTEGEDKPLKYPTIFHTADAAVITKMDLAAAVDFDRVAAHRNIQSVRPGMAVFEVSVKSGDGMRELIRWVETQAGVRLSFGNGRSSTA